MVENAPRSGIALAVKLARRHGARLTGLFAEGQSWPLRLVGGPKRRRPDQGQGGAATFEAAVRAAKLESDWWRIPDGELDLGGVAARFCRYADWQSWASPIRGAARAEGPRRAGAARERTAPSCCIPSAGHFPDVGRRVIVEWNGSREAARALNDAIPLMHEAKEVLVLDVRTRSASAEDEEPAAEVVRHLGAHGIAALGEATYLAAKAARSSGIEALDVLLNRAADFSADLLVMGAGGRHGAPFPRAGRATRKSLEVMTNPVLLSH